MEKEVKQNKLDFIEAYEEEITRVFLSPKIHPNLDEVECRRSPFSIYRKGIFPQEIENLNSHINPRKTRTYYSRSHIEKIISKIENKK